MPQQVQGVISRAKDAPVELVTINVPDPGPGEAVVKVQACGVCHTDLHYVQGGIGDDYPYLLGHEAAGIVEAVGEGVRDLEPGDYVILNWRAVCGSCRACKRGRPWYCFNTFNATQKMTLTDGTELSPALGYRRVHREDPGRGRSVHQGRPGRRPRGRGAARLRGDGRPRGRDQHRQRGPRRLGGRDRLRRGRGGGDRRGPAGRGGHDHRGRHRRAEAGQGHRAGRHPHHQLEGDRRGRGHPGADRRQRRRRRDRRGRSTGDLAAGLLRPRPGRHGGAGRGADPGRCSWSCRCWTCSAAVGR